MAPHEIIGRMNPEVFSQIFTYLFEKEKAMYKATIDSVAKQRNLRPVFIERKPRNERFTWLQGALARRGSDAIAAHLLQIWLVGAHSKLLCDFLDALGITHDENGTVDNLPAPPAREPLSAAIETLLVKYDPAVVVVYLHTFQALDDGGGWPTLAELLESDPRLAL